MGVPRGRRANGTELTIAALLLGFRHGIDWDHIIAISGIAATTGRRRTGAWLGTLYVAGACLCGDRSRSRGNRPWRVGAETPTQVVVFLAAANAGGLGAGLGVLFVFVLGLAISNLAIAVASLFGFGTAVGGTKAQIVLGRLTAAMSLIIGTLFCWVWTDSCRHSSQAEGLHASLFRRGTAKRRL